MTDDSAGLRQLPGSIVYNTAASLLPVELITHLGQGPRDALTLYRDIWTQHLAPDNVRTDNGPTWGQDFAAGKIGIMPGGYGQLTGLVKASQLGTEFMDTPLPGANGGYSTFDGGDDFAIPSSAKNASGAWEFIQCVMQTQQQNQNPA